MLNKKTRQHIYTTSVYLVEGGGKATMADNGTLYYIVRDPKDNQYWLISDRKVPDDLGYVPLNELAVSEESFLIDSEYCSEDQDENPSFPSFYE